MREIFSARTRAAWLACARCFVVSWGGILLIIYPIGRAEGNAFLGRLLVAEGRPGAPRRSPRQASTARRREPRSTGPRTGRRDISNVGAGPEMHPRGEDADRRQWRHTDGRNVAVSRAAKAAQNLPSAHLPLRPSANGTRVAIVNAFTNPVVGAMVPDLFRRVFGRRARRRRGTERRTTREGNRQATMEVRTGGAEGYSDPPPQELRSPASHTNSGLELRQGDKGSNVAGSCRPNSVQCAYTRPGLRRPP